MRSFGQLIDFLKGQRCKAVTVDIAANSTVAVNAPCEVLGIYVNTVLSAHACPIQDDTVAFYTLVASLAAGTAINFPAPVEVLTNLTVDPNDAATGNITIFYRLI